MIKTFEIKLSPTLQQDALLKQHTGCVRWLWNKLLQSNIEKYNSEKKFIFRFEMQRMISGLRHEFPWLMDINCQSLHEQCINFHNTLQRLVKKTGGFPKFKSKHDATESFCVPQRFEICNRFIKLPKIGCIKYLKQRKLEGKIKRIIVKRIDDCWFAYICCELPDVEVRTSFTESEIVGIDVGIKDFVVTSTGIKIANPKHLNKSERSLKKYQRSLSKKVKGSTNHIKTKRLVTKLHRHVANQRKEFQNKLVSEITNQWQVVCLEDLNIKGMVKNRKLSKSIGSVGWGMFKTKIKHKLNETGGVLVEIGRFEPSTKKCSSCGELNHMLTLTDRSWKCVCGVVHDRDINAAINIRNFGISELNRLGTSRIYACVDGEGMPSLKQELESPLGDPAYNKVSGSSEPHYLYKYVRNYDG